MDVKRHFHDQPRLGSASDLDQRDPDERHVPGGKGIVDCTKGGGCATALGVQQQAFGACDDGNPTLTCNNPPDDSGQIVLAQLRNSTDPSDTWASGINQAWGANTFAGGSTPHLVATVEIAGLSNAKPGDPPTTLRFDESGQNTEHATGLIDCGQGQSKPGAASPRSSADAPWWGARRSEQRVHLVRAAGHQPPAR